MTHMASGMGDLFGAFDIDAYDDEASGPDIERLLARLALDPTIEAPGDE